jgi:DNA processing protein
VSAGLSEAERIARLRLARSDTVGPVTFRDLLQHMPNAVEALEALPTLASRGGRKSALRIPSRADAEREIAATEALGAQLIVVGEKTFPTRLAAIDPPPPVVSVMGAAHLLERKAIAIVGSRNASAAGAKIAATIARDLAGHGFTVVSGLARGIDAAAHRASIEGGTVGVLAGGLDIVYPEENRALQTEIGKRGALISEMPPGTRPQARHFPRRNRLISGLSLAVVVVEAALRSGSLITARFALEQGRDVFAVPGSPLDPRAAGSNSLIKQGAALVESAEDIVAALDAPDGRYLTEPESFGFNPAADCAPDPDSATRKRIVSALGPTPIIVDEIVRQTGLPVRTVRVVLLELDLAGRLHRDTGDRVSLLPEDQP